MHEWTYQVTTPAVVGADPTVLGPDGKPAAALLVAVCPLCGEVRAFGVSPGTARVDLSGDCPSVMKGWG